jgi:diacylglycerol kinase family enzyme
MKQSPLTGPAHGEKAPTSGAPLFVVFNIAAGRECAATVRAALERECRNALRELHLMIVQDPQRIPELARAAVTRARQLNGIVVAAGGDGTINAVAQATLGSGCAFGVLPQGTFNYFSRAHGISADISQALQTLLFEPARPVQVGLVNEQVFLVNASLGLYPKLLEDREAWKAQFGRSRLVAFGAGLSTLLRSGRNLRLRIELQGAAHDVRTPTLFIGNNALQLEQLGFAEASAIDAGQLAGIMLKPVGQGAMLRLLVRGALGQLGAADDVVNFAFRKLTVHQPSRFGARRIKVATDGEITWQTLPLTFSVSPHPLLLICPALPAPERNNA